MNAASRLICITLCAAGLLADSTRVAGYYNVPQLRLVCAEYFASNVVVEATLIRSRAIHDPTDDEWLAHLNLIKYLVQFV